MNPINASEHARYDQARARVELVRGLYVHALVFILVNSGLVIYNMTTSPDRLWVTFSILGWGVGLAAHALYVMSDGRFLGPAWQERKIREELERDEPRSH